MPRITGGDLATSNLIRASGIGRLLQQQRKTAETLTSDPTIDLKPTFRRFGWSSG